MKILIYKIIELFISPLKFIVPKGNFVIVHAYNRNVYCDNTKYLFEYLSTNLDGYDVRWLTDSEIILEHLRKNELGYLSLKKPFNLFWILLRAVMVIDSGNRYFNPFNLLGGNRIIKISTMHGCGPKVSHSRSDDIMTAVNQIFNANSFDYVNFPSAYACNWLGRHVYLLPNKKIISLGYPRCDQYYDSLLVEQKHSAKHWAKLLNSNIKESDKIILYTPTWRPYEYSFPLEKMSGFDLENFNVWLKTNDTYFFYTIHTAKIPMSMIGGRDRIIFIDSWEFPLFDINEFMNEVDVLLNDYSTTSVEFSLLERPQIFFMPDYDFYESEKGFSEDYRMVMPGKEVSNFESFIGVLSVCIDTPTQYTDEFLPVMQDLLFKYYDSTSGDSSQKFCKFISEKLR